MTGGGTSRSRSRPRLDVASLGRFDGLTLHARHGLGERPGERRHPGRPQPSGIELESYSAYTPGDDLRHLDWSAVGRLDSLVVRRFTAEREVLFHLLLDVSASMDAPAEDGKLASARELGLALGYIGLAANDAVQLTLLGGKGTVTASPVHRHRRGIFAVAAMLDGARAEGTLRIDVALDAYAQRHREAGAALVISDFMTDPSEVERGILALQARRFAVHLLHVIGASELDPGASFTRGLLVDVESGESHAMAMTPEVEARYQAVLAAHLAALAAVAERTRASYTRVVAGSDVAAFVVGDLARQDLVRRR